MIKWFLIALIPLNLFIYFTDYRYIYKALWYNFPGIDDYTIFHNREIKASSAPQPWAIANNTDQYRLNDELKQQLQELETIAFLVVKDDTIRHEAYFNGYDQSSLSNSFSMAKSIVSLLVGIAIQDGLINDVNDPIANYLPEFSTDDKKEITIEHVLMMSSGLSWDESYAGLFSITTKGYYGTDLKKTIFDLKAIEKPGERFEYRSGDTQLLAILLEKVTGKPLSEYMHEKLWQPLGAEHTALWSLDQKEGIEKAYCCINSNARDFAKIGQLMLHKGRWYNQTIVSEAYISKAIEGNVYDNQHSEPNYGYMWWLIPDYKGYNIFYARGILGQFLICVPDLNCIIVRLGHKRGEKRDEFHHHETYLMIDQAIDWFAKDK